MTVTMRWIYTALLSILITMTPAETKDNTRPEQKVRPASQAGRFYDSDAASLAHEVDSLLARHANMDGYADVAALIVPHAGYYFSGNVAAAAYSALDPQRRYKRVFILGPSHYEWLSGASVDTEFDYYSTPLGRVPVDRVTCQKLAADSLFTYRERAHDREHCLEVQLPFLQRRMVDVPPIVPIVVSTNDYGRLKRMADILKPYFNDDNLFIISSDFSHYPSYLDAYKVDAATRKAVESGDVARFIDVIQRNASSGVPNLDTSACGEYAIIMLMLMMDNGCDIRHILYQNSGDIDSHDHRRVVGYHAFAVNRKGTAAADASETGFSLTDSEKRTLKDIARSSISSAFSGTAFSPEGLTPTLKRKCGAFVTLTKSGRLRGCIGHFGEDVPLHEMVFEMARAAAFEDPRFPRLRREELDSIDIEISVLTPMRRIKSIDEFQLHKHGIYIRKGRRSGTFLPQVADEVNWTKEEFVGHCSQDKAGLGWDGWRDAELFVYEAIVF